jgi:hypothetical protein
MVVTGLQLFQNIDEFNCCGDLPRTTYPSSQVNIIPTPPNFSKCMST